jgi:type IV pilus assembly protein PilA
MLARIRKSMDEKDEGFTLIELLVVMIIIGILAAIAIPVFLNQRQKAVDSSIKSDLKTVATEMETAFVDTNAYPANGAAPASAKITTGNTIVILTNAASVAAKDGFCLKGSNASSNAPGGAGAFFWYDSKLGGLQSGAPTVAAPAGGACA